MPEARRTFGPVVLAGLVAGGLAAWAGTRPWADTPGPVAGSDPLGLVAEAGEMPLGGALGLVVLAAWGVVLVTRGPVRRGVAVVGLLAALGLVATVLVGATVLPDQVADSLATQTGERPDPSSVGWTVWFWVAAVAALGSLVSFALAVGWSPAWPEMGGRFDAPGSPDGQGDATVDSRDGDQHGRSNLDLWKAMDEGQDPTV